MFISKKKAAVYIQLKSLQSVEITVALFDDRIGEENGSIMFCQKKLTIFFIFSMLCMNFSFW